MEKTLDDEDKVVFNDDPSAPSNNSLIPAISCHEALAWSDALFAAGDIPFGNLIMLMRHLGSADLPHTSACPFFRPGALDHA